MQLEYEKNDYFKKLLKMPSNKLTISFLGVLVLLLFFISHDSIRTNAYKFDNFSTCIISSVEAQSYSDARQSSSSVTILQNLNFNRLFQLDLLFRFRLAGQYFFAATLFYTIFVVSRKKNYLFKFFYQIYIKSSIPCRAGPNAGKGVTLIDFNTKNDIKEEIFLKWICV
ncbi:MAG: hypothetical protein IJW31_00975 [Lentisphaeria bacterium]|nr:hypothetical protein [Lentisphaeria bacterium]